ncbi:hypothetical protein D9611_008224 [Ephemerocybe angulata]|uniref:F-box domain-containing protein n=1 Tax=Ephemerocybe angulata TaxID=980116 RepID=A0A8H5BIZ5_9AGAR|nr:hypothetical protein D9611_008224 [Tulosesus angulatus]
MIMSMGSLPQEILDKITDAAADESLKSLKRLSATSKCFLQRCRFHLFGHFVIFYQLSDKAQRMLEGNPSLFSNVRSLRIWVRESPIAEISENEREQISRVLDKLTNLETLWLNDQGSPYLHHDPEAQPIYLSHCKHAFARLFARPKLINIQIRAFENFKFPIHLLHSAHALKSLSVQERMAFSEDPDEDLKPKSPWHLTSLEARNEGLTEIHHLLKSCPSSIYANLVNLQFTINTVQAHRNSMQIINNAAEYSALEMLDLYYASRAEVHRCYDELITSGLTIPSFPFLHYMKLWIDLDDHHPSFLVPDLAANMIARMLCTNAQPLLAVADAIFAWKTPPIGPDFDREQAFIDAKRGWDRIDDTFSDATRFPKLCAIGMTPNYDFPYPTSYRLSNKDRKIIWSGTKAATMAAFSRTRAREGMIFGVGIGSPFAEVESRILSERHEAHYACWDV